MGRTTRKKKLPTMNTTRRASFNNVVSYYSVKNGRGKPTLLPLTDRIRKIVLGQDMLFRSPSLIAEMMLRRKTGLFLGGKPVRIIVLVAHGITVGVTKCPRDMGIFHFSENEYRGHKVSGDILIPSLELVFGKGGRNFSSFLDKKLGTLYGPANALQHVRDTIAYSTPSHLMPDYHLMKFSKRFYDPLDDTIGCWDITSSIEKGTFRPKDYRGQGPALTPIVDLLEKDQRSRYTKKTHTLGSSLSTVLKRLKQPDLVGDSLCIVYLCCCTVFDRAFSPSVARSYPAYTSFVAPEGSEALVPFVPSALPSAPSDPAPLYHKAPKRSLFNISEES